MGDLTRRRWLGEGPARARRPDSLPFQGSFLAGVRHRRETAYSQGHAPGDPASRARGHKDPAGAVLPPAPPLPQTAVPLAESPWGRGQGRGRGEPARRTTPPPQLCSRSSGRAAG